MNDDIKKTRSPSCPRITLQEAIELVKTLHVKSGKSALRPETAVQALGYKGINGAALGVLATLKSYGLLEGERGGNLAVSPLSLRLIHPLSSTQESAARREAALKPSLFAGLFDGGYLACDEDVLSNHLVQSSFTIEGAKKVASVFKANGEFAKLSQESIEEPVNVTAVPPPKPLSIKSSVEHFVPMRAAGGINELAIPLDDGRAAVVPIGMTEETFDMLIESLKLWKRKLVKSEFPKLAVWKNKDHDMPVTIVAKMGERDGRVFYQSSTGTGIPGDELIFLPPE